jgi:hypothetical protein
VINEPSQCTKAPTFGVTTVAAVTAKYTYVITHLWKGTQWGYCLTSRTLQPPAGYEATVYRLGLASVKIAADSPSGDGTSKAEIGMASFLGSRPATHSR